MSDDVPTSAYERLLAAIPPERPLDLESARMARDPTAEPDRARLDQLETQRARVEGYRRRVEAIGMDPAVDSFLTTATAVDAANALAKLSGDLLLEIKKLELGLAAQARIAARVAAEHALDADLPTFEESYRATG